MVFGPALVTSLQPTVCNKFSSYLTHALAHSTSMNPIDYGVSMCIFQDPVALWNLMNTLTNLLLGLGRPRVPVHWTVFFTDSNTATLICQQHSHEHFRYFQLLIDALPKYWWKYSNFKIDPLCHLVTTSMTSWIQIYINVVIIPWYLYARSLIMIPLFISLKPPPPVINDVITLKYIFNQK